MFRNQETQMNRQIGFINDHTLIGCKQGLSTKYAFSAVSVYRGADKSLARPGRKQANVPVRMA